LGCYCSAQKKQTFLGDSQLKKDAFTPKSANTVLPYSGSTDPNYLASFEPVSFNIYFWGINKNDGNSPAPMTYESVMNVMRAINEAFNPHGICFILKGYSYINNDQMHSGSNFLQIRNFAKNNKFFDSNAINCYVPYDYVEGESASGWSNMFSNCFTVRMKWGFSPDVNAVMHELGHIFGLYHTFASSGNGTIIKEHVTRDPKDPNYNALTEGDKVTDTPATPNFYNPNSFGTVPQVPKRPSIVDCIYIGNAKDELGVPFNLTTDDVKNIMGYTPCGGGAFTIGQGIRMMETIYCNAAKNKNILAAMTSN
jgi:hypothetical protein